MLMWHFFQRLKLVRGTIQVQHLRNGAEGIIVLAGFSRHDFLSVAC